MAASMDPGDPFSEAQADVLSTLNTTRSLFSSYLRIRSLAASASSPELIQARNELEATIQDLSSDLQDLVDSVKAVESDPFRYGIDIDEVARRRKLVEDIGNEVEDMRQELKQVATGQKGKGINGSALPPPSAFDPDAPDGDEYEAFEQQRQVEIMHEQDEALDGVFKTVGNLRQQADDMGRELEEQHEMLEDVDTVADRVGGKLQVGIKKVGWVIKNNEVPLWLVATLRSLQALQGDVQRETGESQKTPELTSQQKDGAGNHPWIRLAASTAQSNHRRHLSPGGM
ncbi:MAG: hypothetical protein LQ350_006521 [Teloschistes chrysophthalmus]|nr:MAG: hypothetical protein LQ350_006521 [Niorma chrysophthalma]